MEHADSSPKGRLSEQTAEAFCWLRRRNRNPARDVSQSGFCGCRSNGVVLEKPGRRRWSITAASPELNPGSPGIRNSGTELSGKSRHEEPLGVSRVRSSCQARVQLSWTAWRKSRRTIGERPAVMLGARKLIVQSRWPGRLAVLQQRKLRNRRASLETAETPGSESFSDRLWPYPKPWEGAG